VDATLDFLIRHRLAVLLCTIGAILVAGGWMLVRLTRRSLLQELQADGLSTDLFPSLLKTLRGSPDGSNDIIGILSALGILATAIGAQFKLLWKSTVLVGLLVLAAVIGLVWTYDRNQIRIVTARLNFPEPECNRPSRSGIVVFIHGWTGDALETWKQYPRLMCNDERFAAFDVVSIGYPTLLDNRGFTIAQTAAWIFGGLRDQTKLRDGERLIFVAHSMGGLVAREITLLHRLSQSPGTVSILVELGTPHNGANLAPLATALGISHGLNDDMREGSSHLKGLQVRWNELAARPATLCYSSPQDRVVSQSSAFFQCDFQSSFPVWSHTERFITSAIRAYPLAVRS
jgi:hypothetical protein